MATHVMTTNGPDRTVGHRPSTPTFLTWLEALLQKLFTSWAWYDSYRQTVRELNGLSDAELDDIGVARVDIPTIAMKSANAASMRR
ncbi:MAG: DUF1127 domain-containing protein [Geminicoccaceae bacterium]